ncbi:unnamed protein product [Polarella glacialis]|uniref:Uncharacterized protein n=1 Tax=Polarella glacialis TaxID=89957 RepID=A0A813GE47_POLGL|nr:unnamed protein product [Polarella glacialis]
MAAAESMTTLAIVPPAPPSRPPPPHRPLQRWRWSWNLCDDSHQILPTSQPRQRQRPGEAELFTLGAWLSRDGLLQAALAPLSRSAARPERRKAFGCSWAGASHVASPASVLVVGEEGTDDPILGSSPWLLLRCQLPQMEYLTLAENVDLTDDEVSRRLRNILGSKLTVELRFDFQDGGRADPQRLLLRFCPVRLGSVPARLAACLLPPPLAPSGEARSWPPDLQDAWIRHYIGDAGLAGEVIVFGPNTTGVEWQRATFLGPFWQHQEHKPELASWAAVRCLFQLGLRAEKLLLARSPSERLSSLVSEGPEAVAAALARLSGEVDFLHVPLAAVHVPSSGGVSDQLRGRPERARLLLSALQLVAGLASGGQRLRHSWSPSLRIENCEQPFLCSTSGSSRSCSSNCVASAKPRRQGSAVCLTGLLRSSSAKALRFLREVVVERLPQPVDIFLATAEADCVKALAELEAAGLTVLAAACDSHGMSLYPEEARFKTRGPPVGWNVSRVIMHWRDVRACKGLLDGHRPGWRQDYQVVGRSRLDMVWRDFPIVPDLVGRLSPSTPGWASIWVPSQASDLMNAGVNDKAAFGTPEAMDVYFDTWTFILDSSQWRDLKSMGTWTKSAMSFWKGYLQELHGAPPPHPEILLEASLRASGFQARRHPSMCGDKLESRNVLAILCDPVPLVHPTKGYFLNGASLASSEGFGVARGGRYNLQPVYGQGYDALLAAHLIDFFYAEMRHLGRPPIVVDFGSGSAGIYVRCLHEWNLPAWGFDGHPFTGQAAKITDASYTTTDRFYQDKLKRLDLSKPIEWECRFTLSASSPEFQLPAEAPEASFFAECCSDPFCQGVAPDGSTVNLDNWKLAFDKFGGWFVKNDWDWQLPLQASDWVLALGTGAHLRTKVAQEGFLANIRTLGTQGAILSWDSAAEEGDLDPEEAARALRSSGFELDEAATRRARLFAGGFLPPGRAHRAIGASWGSRALDLPTGTPIL